MTNAALYTRVSTDLQEKEGTIASQQEALRDYAAAKGYTIVAEHTDDGYSGGQAGAARAGRAEGRPEESEKTSSTITSRSSFTELAAPIWPAKYGLISRGTSFQVGTSPRSRLRE